MFRRPVQPPLHQRFHAPHRRYHAPENVCMTDRPNRSFFASVLPSAPPFGVLCAQIRAHGFRRRRPWRGNLWLGPSSGPADIFSSAAHAQVNNEVRKVAQPIGFADIVERVKPSVISVKVNINQKLARTTALKTMTTSPFQPGSPMDASSVASADKMACPRACGVPRAADVV